MRELFLVLAISTLAFGFAGSFVAKNKGVFWKTGFWFGFFLGPIGLIIVALLNPDTVRRISASAQFDGARDLSNDRYQLWLTKKYDIQRNETLGKYSVAEDSFINLDEALKCADHLEAAQEINRIFRKKILKRAAAACLFGVVAIPIGVILLNYIEHHKAIAVADTAIDDRRHTIASVLASAHLPLIKSAKMTDVDYKNNLSTDEIKSLKFIKSTIELASDTSESCSLRIGDEYETDFLSESVWFSSSDSPDMVRSFYIEHLKKAGFTQASDFHEQGKDRLEYANQNQVIFINATAIDGSTNVGICVLRRNEMDKILAKKNDYDRRMTKIQSEYDESMKLLNEETNERQKFIDSLS